MKLTLQVDTCKNQKIAYVSYQFFFEICEGNYRIWNTLHSMNSLNIVGYSDNRDNIDEDDGKSKTRHIF